MIKDSIEHFKEYWLVNPDSFEKNSRLRFEQNTRRIDRYTEMYFQSLKSYFDISEIQSVIITGDSGCNGHALLLKGNSIAFFCRECFSTEKYSKIFVLHEIIHALHYHYNAELFFSNRSEKEELLRQFIVEGVCAYLCKKILSSNFAEVLWADFLEPKEIENWFIDCRNRKSELIQYCSANLNANDSEGIFYLKSSDSKLGSRTGYWISAITITDIILTVGLSELDCLTLTKRHWETLIRESFKKGLRESDSRRFGQADNC